MCLLSLRIIGIQGKGYIDWGEVMATIKLLFSSILCETMIAGHR